MATDQDLRASRLRTARQQAGFEDATKAAEAYGWNTITYRSHENGLRGIKPGVGKKYAKYLGVSLAWLMTGEGSMKGPGIDVQIMALPEALSQDVMKDIKALIAAAKIKGRIS